MSLPSAAKSVLFTFLGLFLGRRLGPSRARQDANVWLRLHCRDVAGKILSIGSGDDSDHEGGYYRKYFPNATSYTTSEVSAEFKCDLVIDVRSMPEIADGTYDGIYCSGVLEHTDEFQAAMRELTRILKTGGTLLLGLPFRQALHMEPYDFWRFTEFGIQHLLKQDYAITIITGIDPDRKAGFPAAYWVKAIKTIRKT